MDSFSKIKTISHNKNKLESRLYFSSIKKMTAPVGQVHFFEINFKNYNIRPSWRLQFISLGGCHLSHFINICGIVYDCFGLYHTTNKKEHEICQISPENLAFCDAMRMNLFKLNIFIYKYNNNYIWCTTIYTVYTFKLNLQYLTSIKIS